MRYAPQDGSWAIRQTAGNAEARAAFTDAEFEVQRASLKLFLCNYFSSGDCSNALNKSISPMGATPSGGKILKVRWGLPGRGKRGGLRLVVVAYCKKGCE